MEEVPYTKDDIVSKAGVFTNNINQIHLNKLQFVYPIIGDNSDVPKWI